MDYVAINSVDWFLAEADVAKLPDLRQLRSRTARKRRVLPRVQLIEAAASGFDELADIWERETRNSSDIDANLEHWAYLAILNLGPPAIPQILDRMKSHGGFWFPALEYLAKWDPIVEDEWGDMQKMTRAWLRWEKSPDAKRFLRNRKPGYILRGISETT